MIARRRRRARLLLGTLVIGLSHPIGLATAGEDPACYMMREFGLSQASPTKTTSDIIARCRAAQNTALSRGLDEKSAPGDTADPAAAIAKAYNNNREPVPRSIYGSDDRLDVEEAEKAFALRPDAARLRKAVRATALIVERRDLTPIPGGWRLNTRLVTYGQYPLCDEEKFSGQRKGGLCTGFLVAEDVLATAGHCVSSDQIDPRDPRRNQLAVVFGFELRNGQLRTEFSADEVFDMLKLRDHGLSPNPDRALVVLDRPVPVATAEPLRVANDETAYGANRALALIGHPYGLPKKLSLRGTLGDGGEALRSPNSFKAQLNAFQGNSGSPVIFGDDPDLVAGILVRGQGDYHLDATRGCARSEVFAQDQQCGGERCAETATKTTLLRGYLP